MIRHILFNRWKPDTPPEAIDKVFEMLSEFPKRFPEIKSFGAYRDAKLTGALGNLKNMDFVVVIEFEDEAGFQTFMGREYHKHVVHTYIAPYREEAARIQYIF
jgi:hypothetical protein